MKSAASEALGVSGSAEAVTLQTLFNIQNLMSGTAQTIPALKNFVMELSDLKPQRVSSLRNNFQLPDFMGVSVKLNSSKTKASQPRAVRQRFPGSGSR